MTRSMQDRVHSQVLKSLVALVSRHDPKLLIRLEADVVRFVSTLPPEDQPAALACITSFTGGAVSADCCSGSESLLEGAPDWIRAWLDAPYTGTGTGSAAIHFEIIPRNAKWRITQEGKLYGEFLTRDDALNTVKAAVEAIRLVGGHADWFDAVNAS